MKISEFEIIILYHTEELYILPESIYKYKPYSTGRETNEIWFKIQNHRIRCHFN